MIDLSKFEIKELVATSNWSDICLFSIDKVSSKPVRVACKSYATGALKDFPHATKERAMESVLKFRDYLINHNIDKITLWKEQPSHVQWGFSCAFNNSEPCFFNE